MPIEFIGILTLLLGGAALRFGPAFAFRSFIPVTLLGAAAAMILPGIGSIQPAHLMLGFTALAVFAKPSNVRYACRLLRCPKPAFWLTLTWAYGTLAAIFVPRLLAGQILVNSIGVTDAAGFTQVPIAPTSGNITQSVYFTGDLVCFLTCAVYIRSAVGFRVVATTLVWYCAANIFMAVLDLATFYTDTAYLLDFIRNANYVIYTDTVVIDMKRIIGSFTESSSFANATIGTLAFSLQLALKGMWPRTCFTIALISVLLLVFSTSTTALLALPVCLGLILVTTFWSAMRARISGAGVRFLIFMPLLGAVLICALLMYEPAVERVTQFLDAMVFTKAGTSSGIERARFNSEGMTNFFETGGIGAGIGSVRTSSFLVAVLANLGIAGTVSYALFLVTAIFSGDQTGQAAFTSAVKAAARAACLCLLVSGSISGALVDLGLPFFFFAALACARPGEEVEHFAPRLSARLQLLAVARAGA